MSSESTFSFTTKINGQDLFTVRGDTYDEFLTNLVFASNNIGVRQLLDTLNQSEEQAVATITNALGATVVASPAPAFTAAMPAAVVAPTVTAVAAPSIGGGKVCSHGQMTAKQGVGKDGKTWRGYMCPAPQGAADKCKNIYIYPSSPEWNTFVAG